MKHFIIIFSWMLSLSAALYAQDADKVILPQKPHRAPYVDYTQRETGFWCALDLDAGSTVLLNHRNMQSVQVTYTAGYRFNEYLKVGLGVGAKYYVNNNEARRGSSNCWTFPLLVNVRGNFFSQADRSMVPYWSVNVGSAINDGFFITPTLGLRFGEQRNSWLLGISYSFNHINTDKLTAPATRVNSMSALLLHVGYEF